MPRCTSRCSRRRRSPPTSLAARPPGVRHRRRPWRSRACTTRRRCSDGSTSGRDERPVDLLVFSSISTAFLVSALRAAPVLLLPPQLGGPAFRTTRARRVRTWWMTAAPIRAPRRPSSRPWETSRPSPIKHSRSSRVDTSWRRSRRVRARRSFRSGSAWTLSACTASARTRRQSHSRRSRSGSP